MHGSAARAWRDAVADDCEPGGLLGTGTATRFHSVFRLEVGDSRDVDRADGVASDYCFHSDGSMEKGFDGESAGTFKYLGFVVVAAECLPGL